MNILKLNKIYLLIGFFIIIAISVIIFILVNEEVQTTDQNKIKRIYDQEVYYPIIKDEKMLFFTNIDNQPGIYSLNIASKEIEKVIDCPSPIDIIWSPDKTKAIVKVRYYDGAFDRLPADFYYFANEGQILNYSMDLISKKITRLDSGVIDIIWKNNQQIIYSYKNNGQQTYTINEANFDGNGWNKLFDLSYGFESIKLQLVNNILYYQDLPTDARNSQLYSYNPETRETKKILEEVGDFSFSLDGKTLLMRKSNNEGTEISNYSLTNTTNYQKIADLTDLKLSYQFIWDENKLYYIGNNSLVYFDPSSNKKRIIIKNDILNSNIVIRDQNNDYLYLSDLEDNAVYQIKK